MNARKIGKIVWGQDGSIWHGFLFRFGNHGECFVYDLQELKAYGERECPTFATFTLDRAERIAPHSNSVTFGTEYFSPEDEFPLLYSNIYNNYAGEVDALKGTTCVYRLQRSGRTFTSTLVQLIAVAFVEDESLWKSSDGDVRPYGNFAIDRENGKYYAFTMRDEDQTTRYFSFALPTLVDGVWDEKYGVKKVVLRAEDLGGFFDCPYHRFIQGACLHDGKIYSLEGFSNDAKNKPALRVIDVSDKRQVIHVDFADVNMSIEPEFIEFYEGVCYYCDGHGNVYELTF